MQMLGQQQQYSSTPNNTTSQHHGNLSGFQTSTSAVSNPLQRHQQPRSKSGKAGSNMANFQHLDKPTAGTGASTAGTGPRGYSLDQNMRNTHGSMGMGSSGKHGNIMMLNKSHNDGKGGHQGTATIAGHQKTQSQGFSQQQPGALLANFTKGANLPQHPSSTTNNQRLMHQQQRLTANQTQLSQMSKHLATSGPAAFQHQQRKLNYSPVMNNQKQTKFTHKKNNLIGPGQSVSQSGTGPGHMDLGPSMGYAQSSSGDQHVNFRLPGKRAHSKNEKYEQLQGPSPSEAVHMQFVNSQQQPQTMQTHQNSFYGPGVPAQKVQNSYDKSQLKMIKGMPNISKGGAPGEGWNGQHQQRYSPLSDYVKNQNTSKEMQKRMNSNNPSGQSQVGQSLPQQARNNNFLRPSSANAKRKDLGNAAAGGQSDFNVNLRQIMGQSGSGMGKKMVNARGHKVKNAYGTGNPGVMNPHMGSMNQEYLNSLLSPTMMGQNYLSQTQNNGMRNSHGFPQGGGADGRRTQQDMQRQKMGGSVGSGGAPSGAQRNINSQSSQKQNLMSPSHPGNMMLGQPGQPPETPQANQSMDPNSKNTVNINMNIMNIGLQGQLIGVNGPVQASHNVLGVGGLAGVGQKTEFNNPLMASHQAPAGGHKRSQSHASKQQQRSGGLNKGFLQQQMNLGQGQESEKGRAGTQQQTPTTKNGADAKQDRSKSNENIAKGQNDKEMVQPETGYGQKRPKSNLDQVAPSNKFLDISNVNQKSKDTNQLLQDQLQMRKQAKSQIGKQQNDNSALANAQEKKATGQANGAKPAEQQQQQPQAEQSKSKGSKPGTREGTTQKSSKPINPAYLQPFSYYSSNPKQMYTNAVTKFAFATKTGLSPSNPNKVNQDMWITVPHFCGLKYCHFFAVADGHGQHGEKVSQFLKQKLPQYLDAQLRFMLKKYTEDLQKHQKDEALNTDEICIAFNNAFLNCNDELFSGVLDIRFSGSTCVTALTLGQKLFCANVGDSRGIVVKKKQGDVTGKLIAQAISRDQKPCQADEAARIVKYGGRIDSFRDPDKNPIGPLRVWLKNDDIPGLAMTRSFGDEVASRVGVTAEPEILELDLCPEDRFIVLASDGVWEFLSNDDIAKIVLPYYECKNAEKAAEAVVRESYLKWKQEEDDIVDDITCVIVFLDVKLPQQEPNIHLQQQYQSQQERASGQAKPAQEASKEGEEAKNA